MPMYTLGHNFVRRPSTGRLRYHGDAPSLCQLVHEGVVERRRFARPTRSPAGRLRAHGGIIPAPRRRTPAPAFVEAEAAKQAGEARVILIGLSGHGHFDMSAYDAYHAASSRTSSSQRRSSAPRSTDSRRAGSRLEPQN